MTKGPKVTALTVKKQLSSLADSEKAIDLSRFFKTKRGEYGEGDVFLGVIVPKQRSVAKKFRNLPLVEIAKLLKSSVHEHRFTALEILVMQYEVANVLGQKKIVSSYLKHTDRVNNWDLVDTSAPYILGPYLYDKDRKILYKLAKSKNIWERRIAILSTFLFIKRNDFSDSFHLVDILIGDCHDLIHKACGWMLREIGKRNKKELVRYLSSRYDMMPRTMLRYGIEKFNREERNAYLNNLI
ncbi:MAG: DNA alkylation repair protein [Candidatus Paceibacterota bacterium]|jgi:3-methyladenine DNA glycosylase AlkD